MLTAGTVFCIHWQQNPLQLDMGSIHKRLPKGSTMRRDKNI